MAKLEEDAWVPEEIGHVRAACGQALVNVVDSSGWLEYFVNGPNTGFFARPIEDTRRLVVLSLSVFEVFKRVLQQRDENAARQTAAPDATGPDRAA